MVGSAKGTLDRILQAKGPTATVLNTSAPVSALPAELLGEIFAECLPEHPKPSLDAAPLLLCRICSRWRDIALATPRLWSSLFFAGRRRRSRADMIAVWLARSGALPLSIDILLFKAADVDTIMVFIPYARRWRHVQLAAIHLNIFTAAVPPLDSLESIVLGPKLKLGTTHEIFGISSMLSSAPKLQSVEWRVEANITLLQLPWRQLTHLRYLVTIQAQTATRLLALCPLLVAVDFLEIHFSMDSEELPTVTLHHLQSFRVLKVSSFIRAILQHLVLPNLREISLDNPHYPYQLARNVFDASFATFIMQASTTLEELSLTRCILDQSSLIHTMSILPALKRIHVRPSGQHTSRISDAFMLALSSRGVRADGTISRLLPQLQSMKLGGRLTFSHDLFVTMIEARCGPETELLGGVLSTVDVEFDTAVDAGIGTVLGKYRDAGIDFPKWLDMVEGPTYGLDTLGS